MSFNIYENGELNKVAGGGVMDAQLDANSTNGVQNKVVTTAINQINADLSDNLGDTNDTFKFATDGAGNYGYVKKVEGADTFFPFKSKMQTVKCGSSNTLSSHTFNIGEYVDNYQNLVLGETLFVHITGSTYGSANTDTFGTVTYNQNTGILTVGKMTWHEGVSNTSLSIKYDVYACV